MTSNTETTAVSTHVAAFSEVEALIAQFEKRHKDVVHDCKTTAGDKAARKDRQEVQQHITSIEAKRVELTEPHLKAQREIMAIATGYKSRLTTLKNNYDTQIRAEETRKAELKRAEELEAQRKRDEAARVEREAAEQREKELREQNERLQAELAAARAEAVPQPKIEDFPVAASFGDRAPEGWERIEAGHELPFAYEQELAVTQRFASRQQASTPAAHDDGLLDLLDAGTAHAISTPNTVSKHAQRPATGFELPTSNEVADALSAAAKRRTTIRNVTDVLEAIRWIRDGR